MKQHSRDTDGKAFSIGKQAESDFVTHTKTKGWEVVKSTKEQNCKEHWDYLLTKGDEVVRVDVKAAKRLSRSDESTQTEKIWIEFKNGIGQDGWLYGKADVISFQEGDTYLNIPRKALAERVEKLVSQEYVTSSSQALYKLYRRFRRRDLLTMVYRKDIEDLHIEW